MWLLIVLVSWPIWLFIRAAGARLVRWPFVIQLALLLPLLACLILWIVLINIPEIVFYGAGPGPAYLPLTNYQVTIEPANNAMDSFKVEEQVSVLENGTHLLIRLPTRQVSSTSRGFLLQEVSIAPLQADSSNTASLTLPDGTLIRGRLCDEDGVPPCPESEIQVRNFPQGSFYMARYPKDEPIKRPYVDTETVTWSIRRDSFDLERGIVFAYIPGPYYLLHTLLAPLVGLSSLGEVGIALLGLIGTGIVTPIATPVLYDIAKTKFKAQLEKMPKTSPKSAKLVISGEGEEKDIETQSH